MLEPLVARVAGSRRRGLRGLLTVPTDVTDAETSAACQVARSAGVAELSILPEPLAAAVGCGIDLSLPYAQMLVDVGEGVTDAVIFRSGEIVASRARRVGCNDLRTAVASVVTRKFGVSLPRDRAERILRELFAMVPPWPPLTLHFDVDGRALSISAEEIDRALWPVEESIVSHIDEFVRELPPATGVEVIESGIWLTGGGAMFERLVTAISRRVQIDLHRARRPLRSVIEGARLMASGAA